MCMHETSQQAHALAPTNLAPTNLAPNNLAPTPPLSQGHDIRSLLMPTKLPEAEAKKAIMLAVSRRAPCMPRLRLHRTGRRVRVLTLAAP
eukprot:2112612-Pleurochrysis_carterae.AAC.1